jgi:hypothetical protein
VITHGLQFSERVSSEGPLQIGDWEADIFSNVVRGGVDILKGMKL